MSDEIVLGNTNLIHTESAAILNSRQSAYPVGRDAWVQKTLRAVEYIAGRGMTVVTSLGMNTWELVLACAGSVHAPVIVVAPDESVAPDDIITEYGIRESRLCLILPSEKISEKKKRLADRDRRVCRRADWLLPVAVKAGGNLDCLLSVSGDRVFDRYRTPFVKPGRTRPRYHAGVFSDDIIDDGWLIHFTRSSRGPWPGESKRDYYRSLVASGDTYSHSAVAGLERMLRDGLIRGSSLYIRTGHRAVGFTLYNRHFARDLFRYRPRLANPYFEPYGIALSMNHAAGLDLFPVIYGDDAIFADLPDGKRPYFQAVGKDGKWPQEREWRALGDIHLGRLDPADTRTVVATPAEKADFEAISPFPVVTIFG